MIETLKATGGENEFFARWAGYQAKALWTRAGAGRQTQLSPPYHAFVGALSTASSCWPRRRLVVMDGQLTVGLLVAYQALIAALHRGRSHSLVTFGSTVQELEADMNRLDDVLRPGRTRVCSGRRAAQTTARSRPQAGRRSRDPRH